MSELKITNNIEKEKFSLFVDYSKAIGILAVILGHLPNVPMLTFNFITPYMYHMPLFFFIGGMLFRPGKKLTHVLKKVFTQYVLYTSITYVIIGLISNYAANKFGIHLSNPLFGDVSNIIKKAFLSNMHNNKMFMVAWFLVAYAIVYVISNIITSITTSIFKENKLIYIAISIVLGLIAVAYLPQLYASTKMQSINLLCQVLVGMMFYALGYLFNKNILNILTAFGFIISFSIVIFLVKFGVLSMFFMAWSKYPNGAVVSIIGACCGIYCILYLAKLLACTEHNHLIRLIGSSSKTIMSWHMMTFLCLDIIISKMGYFDISKYNNTGYKSYNNPNFWLLYIFAGLLVPVAFSHVFQKIRNIIWQYILRLSTQRKTTTP